MRKRHMRVSIVKRVGSIWGVVMAVAGAAHGQGGPVAAERLVVRFDRGTYSLAQRDSLSEVLPPSDPAPPRPASGFWFELQSSEGSVLYRRIIGDPIRLVFEGGATGAPGEPIVRTESIPEERVFAVLVPADDSAESLVLFSSPLRLNAQGEPASEVARLPLLPIVK